MKPELIPGGMHLDARGRLRFCNDFDMGEVKRFYTISNSGAEPRRGWIMHKRETKWFFPLSGKTIIHVEEEGLGGSAGLEGLEGSEVSILSESSLEPPKLPKPAKRSFILDADAPAVLKVPPGHWFLIEQDGTAEVQVFSNCHVGEFANDDFRR